MPGPSSSIASITLSSVEGRPSRTLSAPQGVFATGRCVAIYPGGGGFGRRACDLVGYLFVGWGHDAPSLFFLTGRIQEIGGANGRT
jgi:hypothetical protein